MSHNDLTVIIAQLDKHVGQSIFEIDEKYTEIVEWMQSQYMDAHDSIIQSNKHQNNNFGEMTLSQSLSSSMFQAALAASRPSVLPTTAVGKENNYAKGSMKQHAIGSSLQSKSSRPLQSHILEENIGNSEGMEIEQDNNKSKNKNKRSSRQSKNNSNNVIEKDVSNTNDEYNVHHETQSNPTEISTAARRSTRTSSRGMAETQSHDDDSKVGTGRQTRASSINNNISSTQESIIKDSKKEAMKEGSAPLPPTVPRSTRRSTRSSTMSEDKDLYDSTNGMNVTRQSNRLSTASNTEKKEQSSRRQTRSSVASTQSQDADDECNLAVNQTNVDITKSSSRSAKPGLPPLPKRNTRNSKNSDNVALPPLPPPTKAPKRATRTSARSSTQSIDNDDLNDDVINRNVIESDVPVEEYVEKISGVTSPDPMIHNDFKFKSCGVKRCRSSNMNGKRLDSKSHGKNLGKIMEDEAMQLVDLSEDEEEDEEEQEQEEEEQEEEAEEQEEEENERISNGDNVLSDLSFRGSSISDFTGVSDTPADMDIVANTPYTDAKHQRNTQSSDIFLVSPVSDMKPIPSQHVTEAMSVLKTFAKKDIVEKFNIMTPIPNESMDRSKFQATPIEKLLTATPQMVIQTPATNRIDELRKRWNTVQSSSKTDLFDTNSNYKKGNLISAGSDCDEDMDIDDMIFSPQPPPVGTPTKSSGTPMPAPSSTKSTLSQTEKQAKLARDWQIKIESQQESLSVKKDTVATTRNIPMETPESKRRDVLERKVALEAERMAEAQRRADEKTKKIMEAEIEREKKYEEDRLRKDAERVRREERLALLAADQALSAQRLIAEKQALQQQQQQLRLQHQQQQQQSKFASSHVASGYSPLMKLAVANASQKSHVNMTTLPDPFQTVGDKNISDDDDGDDDDDLIDNDPIRESFPSYEMTDREYNSDDDESDDGNRKNKRIPRWASRENVNASIVKQQHINPEKIFKGDKNISISLDLVFEKKKARFYKRNSTGVWNTETVEYKELENVRKQMNNDTPK